MASQKPTHVKKRVVIIGGGFSGITLAKKLQGTFDVTLIDKKDYFESTPSLPMTLVKPNHLVKIRCPYQKFLKKCTILTEEVRSLRKGQVIIGDGVSIDYDFLCIGTGARYDIPQNSLNIGLNPLLSSDFQTNFEILQTKVSLVVVGGGTAGVELAGELAAVFPQKVIHLLSSTNTLMERSLPNAHVRVAAHFGKNYPNLTLHLGEMYSHVEEPTEEDASTFSDLLKENTKILVGASGLRLAADLVYFCHGLIPNSEIFSSSDDEFRSCLDQRNYVLVNENLQIEGFENVFAMGDVTAIREEKLAQAAQQHAFLIAKNVKRLAKGKPLLAYKSKRNVMIVSMGPHKAMVADGLNVRMEGFMASKLKQLVEFKIMKFDA
eukprot:TRINITY_DN10020_c0_g1_i1.p1 TRINITY_DN10020_c0_g1~~TRINITY_DN10020_c0_g1_i1.p1  ORF type:complete len:378 (-),score=79.88 TRINITY_DN10020_c0_g1_i1:52-1185(-)